MPKAPAFQLYAQDFDMDTGAWTAQEVGVYLRLLLYEWVNGPIPDDIDRLARIARHTVNRRWRAEFIEIWKTVGTKFCSAREYYTNGVKNVTTFPQNFDGKLVNVRLEKTREEQEEYFRKLSESGRLGGLKAQDKKRLQQSNPSSNPLSEASSEVPSKIERLQSSSSSSITTNTTTKERSKDLGVKRFTPPTLEEVKIYCLERGKGVDPERWMDHYLSNGWKVGKALAPMKDWKAAVRTWEGGNNGNGNQGRIKRDTGRHTEESDPYAGIGVTVNSEG